MSLHQSAASLLNQIDGVISQLSDEQYGQPVPVLSHSTIGQHVRHTLEFFICLIESRDTGRVNYDERRRNPYLEQEVHSSRNVLRSIQNFLANEEADRPLQLAVNYSTTTNAIHLLNTSFYRELAYTIEHAVHHMALLKVGIISLFPFVNVPPHFGVASSTIRYHQLQKTE